MSFSSSQSPFLDPSHGALAPSHAAHQTHAAHATRRLAGIELHEVRRGLTALLRRRVPPQDVEDVAQTVLCDALAAAHVPSDPEEFRRWLTGIARHKIADYHRRAARGRARTSAEAGDGADLVPVLPPAFEEREVLGTLLAETRTRRDAETMEWLVREHDGERLIDIASEEGLPAPVVRQRISRFRRALRARYLGVFGLAVLLGGGAYALHRTGTEGAAVATPAPHAPTAHPSIAADPAARPSSDLPTPPNLAREAQGDWVIQTVTPTRALGVTEQRFLDLHTKNAVIHVAQREIVLESKGIRLAFSIAKVTKTATGLHVTVRSDANLLDTIDLTIVQDDRGTRLDAALHGPRFTGALTLRRPIL